MKTMKRPYQIFGMLLFCLAIFLGTESLKMRYYTSLGPGPGFFPFWLSVLLAVLAGFMFWQATFGRTKAAAQPKNFIPKRDALLKMGAVIAGLIIVIIFLEPLGFCLTMFVFNLFILTTLGHHNWLFKIIIAFCGSFGVYYVFVHWLSCPLPIGILAV